MTAVMSLPNPPPAHVETTWRAAPAAVARGQTVAVGFSVLLHVGMAGLLLGWQPDTPPAAQTTSVEARLITLPTIADATPAPPAAPPPVAPASVTPASVTPASVAPPAPAPEAELARRRIERNEQQPVEQQRLEQQRRESERLERQQREQHDQAAQRAVEAQAAQQARQDAERAATAQAVAAEAASRRYEPIEKIAPGYPARAMERRIEGDCTVRYTVSAGGRVEHPEVVGDCHPLFVVPSLVAAKRFRYQPRIVDGRAVAVPGVTNTFHYRIQPQR